MSRLTIAFAAGDVGGARAILPVARLAGLNGHHIIGMRHGTFFAEGSSDWTWRDKAVFSSHEFWEREPDALVYATSVSDFAAVDAGLIAHECRVPAVHVLDNWSSYSNRLKASGGRILVPDCYAVMDELAKGDAIADGVPEGILSVTGHPGLARLAQEAVEFTPQNSSATLKVLFVSEPAFADSGGRESSGWRGYDEVDVSRLTTEAFCSILQAKPAVSLHVSVVPHPRENRTEVAERWASLLKGSLISWELVEPGQVRASLHSTDCVAGMTSILLYEAWLLGIPVLSLQPGLCRAELAALSRRDGVLFCTDRGQSKEAIERLLELVRRPQIQGARLAEHVSAAMSIFNIVIALANAPTSDAIQKQDLPACH